MKTRVEQFKHSQRERRAFLGHLGYILPTYQSISGCHKNRDHIKVALKVAYAHTCVMPYALDPRDNPVDLLDLFPSTRGTLWISGPFLEI